MNKLIIILIALINFSEVISMESKDFSNGLNNTPREKLNLKEYLELLPSEIRPEVIKRVANSDLENLISVNKSKKKISKSRMLKILNKFISSLAEQVEDKNLLIEYIEKDLSKILDKEIYDKWRGNYKIVFDEPAFIDGKKRKNFGKSKSYRGFHSNKDHIDRRKSLKVNLNSLSSLLKDRNKNHKNMANTALTYTAKYGYTDIAKLLIALRFSDVNEVDNKGNTALIYAVKNNNPEMVKALIYREADVNLKNNKGNTALIYAVKNNFIDIAKILLKNKDINVNEKNNFNYTALFYAVFFAYTDLVELLLEHGADKNIGALENYIILEIGSTPYIYSLLNFCK